MFLCNHWGLTTLASQSGTLHTFVNMFGSFFFATARVAPNPHIIDIPATLASNMISEKRDNTVLTIQFDLEERNLKKSLDEHHQSKNIHTSSSVFIGHSPVDRSYKSCLKLLTHHSSNLLMRGKLSVKHYVSPAHVKAGFK